MSKESLSKKSQKYMYRVLNLIERHKKENPILSRHIERTFDISGVNVREIVHYLRVYDKRPICSDSTGYFYARNKMEASHTVKQLRSRVKHINEAATALESAQFPETQEQLGLGLKVEQKKFKGYWEV